MVGQVPGDVKGCAVGPLQDHLLLKAVGGEIKLECSILQFGEAGLLQKAHYLLHIPPAHELRLPVVGVVADVHSLQRLLNAADGVLDCALDLGYYLRVSRLVAGDDRVGLIPDAGLALHELIGGDIDLGHGVVCFAAVQLEMVAAYHHHGLLAAHVVYVILSIDGASRPAQYAN